VPVGTDYRACVRYGCVQCGSLELVAHLMPSGNGTAVSSFCDGHSSVGSRNVLATVENRQPCVYNVSFCGLRGAVPVRRGCALGSQTGTFINVSLTVLGGDPVHSPNESPPIPPFDPTNTGMGNEGNVGNDFSEHVLQTDCCTLPLSFGVFGQWQFRLKCEGASAQKRGA